MRPIHLCLGLGTHRSLGLICSDFEDPTKGVFSDVVIACFHLIGKEILAELLSQCTRVYFNAVCHIIVKRHLHP